MDIFTPDFKQTPYWWEAAPPENAAAADVDLPAQVDVAIVGSGYTGLHAAIQTAQAGRSTVVLEAETPGFGASTRNGGQISTSVKAAFPHLSRSYGPDLAAQILAEGQASLDFIKSFVADHRIDCDFQIAGRFHGAHTARKYDDLARSIAVNRDVFSDDAFMVSRADQPRELGTQAYHGGIVYPHHASLHPAKYHKGLLGIARAKGATIVPHCRVQNLRRDSDGFRLTTARGALRAKRVVLATNGYSGALGPWQQRRIIPIGSYVIATEDLPGPLMERLMPTNRILSDTRKLVYYYRPSPDRKRIVFGGRVSLRESDPTRTGPKLHAELIRLFPELAQTRIAHSWTGLVGYTFDTLMHAGDDDGLYHAMGYCGSGVGMASYLGMRIGQCVADNPDGITAFHKIPFPTRPFYSGNPWFLAPSVLAYRLRDRMAELF